MVALAVLDDVLHHNLGGATSQGERKKRDPQTKTTPISKTRRVCLAVAHAVMGKGRHMIRFVMSVTFAADIAR